MKTLWVMVAAAAVALLIGGAWYYYSNENQSGAFCGGIAGIKCPDGYTCKIGGSYPDAGGTCVRQ